MAATVADYFAMLTAALHDEDYNKARHRRRLQQMLNERSEGAIEFKHCNISAVLIEMGLPYIDGYKPRSNYQASLHDEIVAQLEGADALIAATARAVDAAALGIPTVHPDIFVDVPRREQTPGRVYERPAVVQAPRLGVNYLEREARNASLGLAGEQFVMEVEARRLHDAGKRALARRIEHVSTSKGDGLGYDIASFETDGRERLIEVKTTRFGSMTPFFASRREVDVSAERDADYHLYRLFSFGEGAKIFDIQGSLRATVSLDPVQFSATLR